MSSHVIYRELQRSVGEAGEIEPETEAFLIENDIDFGDFSFKALDCLPKQAPWTIPPVGPLSECAIPHIRWYSIECTLELLNQDTLTHK